MSATAATGLAGAIRESWTSQRLNPVPSLDDYLDALGWRYARGHISLAELEAKLHCALESGAPPALWLQSHQSDRPGAVIYYDPSQSTPSY